MNPRPAGECVDREQNVYVTDFGSYSIFEYAHGATTPKRVLSDPAGSPDGCAVDPKSGDLAVASSTPTGFSLIELAVYRKARGKPTLYSGVNFTNMSYCAYDNKGNVFVDGSDQRMGADFILAELPKGAASLQNVTLNQTISSPGGVQWNGKHLAIGDYLDSVIYQFDVSGSGGTEVGETQLTASRLVEGFYLDGLRVLNPTSPDSGAGSVDVYAYPKGGDPLRELSKFSYPVSVVVSRFARLP